MSDNRTDARVLMVGPDRSLKGGIVSVVEGYFEAGLEDRCSALCYQGTGAGSSLLEKNISFARALLSYCRKIANYDVVHLHISAKGSFKRKSIMANIAKHAGKKVILHEHSGEFARDFEAGDDGYRQNIRRVFNSVDRVVVLSEEWHDYFAENVVSDPGNLTVLHNGVPIPPVNASPCKHHNVLFMGRLDDRKSPDILLRASKSLLLSNPDIRIIFGGDGELDRYRELACELGIADRCDFIGWVVGVEKDRLFRNAGIYCLPSKNEAMPMSVMEAMSYGVPVITTNVGGVPQLIQNGLDGLLMEVDDVEGLSRLLTELSSSPKMRSEIGFAGRKKIIDCFSVQSSIDNLVNIYQDLFEGRIH